ncbi:MAG: hypothetical protein ABJ327_11485 [Litoreibacter sp.]
MLHPALAETYKRNVVTIADSVKDAMAKAEASELLKGLISTAQLRHAKRAPTSAFMYGQTAFDLFAGEASLEHDACHQAQQTLP